MAQRSTRASANPRVVGEPEIVFSIIPRKVIKPADFADLDALADRLRRFEDRYNQTAAPFDWRFTTDDLTALLQRVDSPNTAAALAA